MTPNTPALMGILNVTPDSFSDGGRYNTIELAVAQGLQLERDGADWLDIGGESTRPGAAPVSEKDEIARTLPVVTELAKQSSSKISIDTMKPQVARAAITAGAHMWNDVSAGRFDEKSLTIAADLNCELCLMHMLGEPRTMQNAPHYLDVVSEVIAFLRDRADIAIRAGVSPEKIWIDPGIGFGKTLDHNLALIRAIDRIIEETGLPILFGASRKSFIGKIDKNAVSADNRLAGSLVSALYAASKGARILRVHDVKDTKQAIRLAQALENGDEIQQNV